VISQEFSHVPAINLSSFPLIAAFFLGTEESKRKNKRIRESDNNEKKRKKKERAYT